MVVEGSRMSTGPAIMLSLTWNGAVIRVLATDFAASVLVRPDDIADLIFRHSSGAVSKWENESAVAIKLVGPVYSEAS